MLCTGSSFVEWVGVCLPGSDEVTEQSESDPALLLLEVLGFISFFFFDLSGRGGERGGECEEEGSRCEAALRFFFLLWVIARTGHRVKRGRGETMKQTGKMQRGRGKDGRAEKEVAGEGESHRQKASKRPG